MTNPFTRGSAPGRGQPAYLRPGSFQNGHEKRGGRKRGTPNAFTIDKRAIIEAAYRIGEDGNGRHGVCGYLMWVAEYHPRAYVDLLLNQLSEDSDCVEQDEPCQTTQEVEQSIREYIGLKGKNRAKRRTVEGESQATWSWTGQPYPVGALMQLAILKPRAFCKLLIAAFLRAPAKRHRPCRARSPSD